MSNRNIYLDNAATTITDCDILGRSFSFVASEYGNAGSVHRLGLLSRDAVEKSRANVAAAIGTTPDHIIFTSSGTEANNLAISSAMRHIYDSGSRASVVISTTEHSSVDNSSEMWSNLLNVNREYVRVGADGTVNADSLKRLIDSIDEGVGFVSIIAVNNETGAKNDINRIGKICKERGILFHTDCVQALTYGKINVKEVGCDMLSLSGHKVHAGKGVGALYVRDTSLIKPLICGGSGQENGLRGGTEDVAAIVRFGMACKKLMQDGGYDMTNVANVFLQGLDSSRIKLPFYNGGNIVSVVFPGIDAETLLLMLSERGVYASAGSACSANETVPSRVLVASGLSREEAMQTVRFSFGKYNTEEEASVAAVVVNECISLLSGGIL